jgi:hypothetical protein
VTRACITGTKKSSRAIRRPTDKLTPIALPAAANLVVLIV